MATALLPTLAILQNLRGTVFFFGVVSSFNERWQVVESGCMRGLSHRRSVEIMLDT